MNPLSTWRYICSVSLCLGILASSVPTWGQALPWPTGLQISMDVLRLFKPQYASQGIQYELNGAIDVASCILEGDGGWGIIHWKGHNATTNTSSSYASSGRYFRVGLNYNLLPDTPDKNQAFLGLRYAWNRSKDRLVSQILYDSKGRIEDNSNPIAIDSEQNGVRARWFEVVAGVKVKVWRWVYVGSTVRYKFGLHVAHPGFYIPYDVMGWGLNDTKHTLGFNLYLSLRIPFVRSAAPSNL